MNLKDLNNIDINDLKNIDWGQVTSRLKSRPDYTINGLLGIATLAVVFWSVSGYLSVSRTSKTQTRNLEKRLVAVEKLDKIKREYEGFLKEVPEPIPGDQLIQTLSELAIRRSVQIVSFSPAEEKNDKLIRFTSVKVNIASKSYADIILFVNDIEESSYPIRITNWSGSSLQPLETNARSTRRSSRSSSYDEESQEDVVKATITIESVEFKHAR